MVKAKALQALKKNGLLYGYKLQDENGTIMDIKTEAIIGAIKANKINISNLYIDSSGSLIMSNDNTSSTEKTKSDTPSKEVVLDKSLGDNNSSNHDIVRMQYLISTLNKATKVYEQGKDELMNNKEWDSLYDELVTLEAKTGTVLGDSPTQNIGYEVVSNLPKETHETRMLSLEKTKSRDDLKAFLGTHEGVLSWKLDGLTVVLTYIDGDLDKAVTRGNGEVGEIVTPNVKQFKNVPRHIALPGKLVLRGEAIIKYSTFERINQAITSEDDKYKNPRNLCSGSVRQLDSKITAERSVEWYCFEVLSSSVKTLSNNFDEQLAFAKVLGFDVVENHVVNSSNIDNIIDDFSNKIKAGYDIPSDGLVLTYRNRTYGNSLGCTTKTPRHSKAFKWKDEVAETELLDIEWSPSRTGLINPVAIFKPVDLEGSTVGRASVHNVSILKELELGYGDIIEVYKANMIIPQISSNKTCSDTCEIPEVCPACGGPTSIHEEPSSGVLTLWCENEDCPAKGNRLLKHFVSRDAMNIDGISGKTLEKLVDEGLITDFASIYHLNEHRRAISEMEGFGDKSFMNMISAIEKSRVCKVSNLLYALGIPNVGLATAKLICKHFNYDLGDIVCASYNQLVYIDGIGDVIADSIVEYFNNEDKLQELTDLVKELKFVQEKVSEDTSMNGVVICVTGAVNIFPNRKAVQNAIEDRGGKFTTSVSRSTSYLVTNDTSSGSRKNRAAQEYGITILTEKEFIDKFNIEV